MPSAPRDLRALPKAHLHVHLEGAMRPSTLAELADAAGIAVPQIRGYGSFTAFADTYLAACAVLRTPEDFARLVYEVVEDSALDGAVWVEPSFYAPHHRDRFGADEDIIDMVLDAAASAAERLGVGVGVMIAADRTADPAIAVDQAADRRRTARPRRGVVRPGQRRGARRPRALRRGVRARQGGAGSSRHRTPESWSAPNRCAARSTRWRRIVCSTGCGPSRTPSWWSVSPTPRSASTCVRRRTSCSRSIRRPPSTRCRSSWRRVSAAASTATTRSCSGPVSSTSTRSRRRDAPR